MRACHDRSSRAASFQELAARLVQRTSKHCAVLMQKVGIRETRTKERRIENLREYVTLGKNEAKERQRESCSE